MERSWLLLFLSLLIGFNQVPGVTAISMPWGLGGSMSWSVMPPPYSLQWYLNLRQQKMPLVVSSPLHPPGAEVVVGPPPRPVAIFKRPVHIFEDRLFPTLVKVDPFTSAQNRLFPSHPVQDLMTFVGQPRLFPTLFGRELNLPSTNESDAGNGTLSDDQAENLNVTLAEIEDDNPIVNDSEAFSQHNIAIFDIQTPGTGSVLLSRLRRSASQNETQKQDTPQSRSMSSSIVIFPGTQTISQSNSPDTDSTTDELRFSPGPTASSIVSNKEDLTGSASTNSDHLDASGKLFMDGVPLFGGYYSRPHPFYPRPILGSPDIGPSSTLYSAASSSPTTSFLSSSINSGPLQQQQQQHLQSSNHHSQLLAPPHPHQHHPFLYPAMSAMYPAVLPHYPLAIGHHGYYPFPSPYQAVSVESLLVPLIGLVGLSLLVPDIIKTKREGRPSDIGGIDVFRRGSVNASLQDEDCLRRLACEAGVLFSEDDDVEAIQRALEKAITAKRLVPAHHVGDQFPQENKTACNHHTCASWMLDVNQLSSMSSVT